MSTAPHWHAQVRARSTRKPGPGASHAGPARSVSGGWTARRPRASRRISAQTCGFLSNTGKARLPRVASGQRSRQTTACCGPARVVEPGDERQESVDLARGERELRHRRMARQTMTIRNLDKLLKPRSIVLVGASPQLRSVA